MAAGLVNGGYRTDIEERHSEQESKTMFSGEGGSCSGKGLPRWEAVGGHMWGRV